uniref:Syntaxin 6/10/61 N-terminal domain-containing protein n=1 Tax=Lactuca sativa TaxID=4236 RepID=A0A9R1XMK3_LACSA|nr:hypothetical protein LSAT_V11C300136990 [Lactuca sativa]
MYMMHALGLTLVDQLSVEFKPIRVYSYIEWQVDELEKAISEAARDPAKYGIDQPELERRFKWTRAAMTQWLEQTSSTFSEMYQELMSLLSARQQPNHGLNGMLLVVEYIVFKAKILIESIINLSMFYIL